SETTPVTVPSASRTGSALTRHSRSLAAISLNDTVSLTHTGSADMTSLTVFILITLQVVPYAPSLVPGPPDRAEPLVGIGRAEGRPCGGRAARLRTSQRRISSAPPTMKGEGATMASCPGERDAVPKKPCMAGR